MIVEIRRNGCIYRDEYKNGGHPAIELDNGNLPVVGKCNKSDTGTKVIFYPDSTIFETIEFKPDIIMKKLKEVAFLNRNLVLTYTDEVNDIKKTYCEEFVV